MGIRLKMVIMIISQSEWAKLDGGIRVVRSGIPSRKRLVPVEMSPSYQIYDLELDGWVVCLAGWLVGNLSLFWRDHERKRNGNCILWNKLLIFMGHETFKMFTFPLLGWLFRLRLGLRCVATGVFIISIIRFLILLCFE